MSVLFKWFYSRQEFSNVKCKPNISMQNLQISNLDYVMLIQESECD